ncbi:MAG: DNA polymerase III subunit gamma/tau, partial [Bacteroidales bacterium]|nr:DNA polymerase III subunit gamma/tau [Bacteroidales bacterium]
MENFVVSARKYRPDSFDSVVGQPSITRTLKNAIKANQLAHAYLFCGPRGVGKTTCARIFAKTINCQNLQDSTEACGECESCQSFKQNRSFTIHELDAASNNHVDDIRNLIEQVRIPPQLGKYSIYIIDEVHMLSQQAFNAFLKTLEEPPAHAIFILATTEKHKIIPTILSRCQIFDFHRIKIPDMMQYLSEIAELEGVTAEDAALNIIAQKADGSMRDALSIFDQVVSFSGKNVDYHTVVANLNVLDFEYYFTLTEAFLQGNYQSALMVYNEILNKGFDSHNFINGLGAHFRNLLVTRDPQTIQLMELSGDIADQYILISKECSVDWLLRGLDVINACDISYKQAKDQRLHIEIALLKLSGLSGHIKEATLLREEANGIKVKQTVDDQATGTEQDKQD